MPGARPSGGVMSTVSTALAPGASDVSARPVTVTQGSVGGDRTAMPVIVPMPRLVSVRLRASRPPGFRPTRVSAGPRTGDASAGRNSKRTVASSEAPSFVHTRIVNEAASGASSGTVTVSVMAALASGPSDAGGANAGVAVTLSAGSASTSSHWRPVRASPETFSSTSVLEYVLFFDVSTRSRCGARSRPRMETWAWPASPMTVLVTTASML